MHIHKEVVAPPGIRRIEILNTTGSRLMGTLMISRVIHEYLRSLHPAAHRHEPADGRDRVVRHRRVSHAACERPADSGLPDHSGPGRPPRRRSGHDGRGGREPARTAVHDHRRPGLDDLVELGGQQPGDAAVRSGAADGQRRGRRADGDLRGAAAAASRDANASDLSQAEPGRPGHPAAGLDVEHRAAVGSRRLRGNRHRSAHLDGERRRAGSSLGPIEVRRPRSGGSRQAAGAADRHRRSRPGASELERESAHRPALRPADGPTTSRRPDN